MAEMFMKRIFEESESLFVTDTYQFDDYSKYESTLFDVERSNATERGISQRLSKSF